MLVKALALSIAVLAVSACSTNRVGLTYQSSPAVVIPSASSAMLSVGSFVDRRGETATWFGAIRGGYGNPLKTLEATQSISVLVQTAFSDGLRARGLQSSNAGYQISGIIKNSTVANSCAAKPMQKLRSAFLSFQQATGCSIRHTRLMSLTVL